MSQIIEDLSSLREDASHPFMGFLHDPGDLFINLTGFFFTVGFAGRKTFGEKHRLTGPFIGHQSQAIAHAVFGDHGPGNVCSPL